MKAAVRSGPVLRKTARNDNFIRTDMLYRAVMQRLEQIPPAEIILPLKEIINKN
jgi:hypothetical protein